ncbi:MAG: multicopper oxidase domain-containing protein [candidate division WOR-3 bacterium]
MFYNTKRRLKNMKRAKTLLKILFITIISIGYSLACDWCNKKLYSELILGQRNDIRGKELLALVQKEQSQQSKIPDDFIQIIERDKNLPIPQTSYVKQDVKADVKFTIEMREGEVYLGNGVFYKGFNISGKIPGPMLIVNEGDIVEFEVINKGSVPHGLSIHAAYTQTSKYLGKIMPGEKRIFKFKATYPGVYLYHCAPGGHAIMLHTIFGQYGMIVVKPKKKYKLEQILNKKPDVEIYLIQHEVYASGKDGIDGQPIYVLFNGEIFRYVKEPIMARPGDYVRIYFLNVGPNLISTFHIVGIIWDFAYWQGHPDNVFVGGQSVLAGPTDSWVVEFRVPPEEGDYAIVSHAFGTTDRGAVGILRVKKDARVEPIIKAEGPTYTSDEMANIKKEVIRVVAPFEPGTEDVDVPAVFNEKTKEVVVRIKGNSFYPKVIDIVEGTKVKWINEDVFTYAQGEFAGIHNVQVVKGPEQFTSPLLLHAQSYEHVFTKPGEYDYICTPHPYMKAIVRVRPKPINLSGPIAMFLSIVALAVAVFVIMTNNKRR